MPFSTKTKFVYLIAHRATRPCSLTDENGGSKAAAAALLPNKN